MSQEPSLRLSPPVLMLVTDRHLAGGFEALVAAVEAAVEGGLNAVQLRERDLPPTDLLALARRLRAVTSGRALLFVNSSLEVALAAGADGIHLPEAAPTIERPDRPLLVGRSVHSREAARRAWGECSDYIIAGPIFGTASHPVSRPAGLELVQTIAGAVAIPVLAIGGITAYRVEDVVRAGASGVAVISAVLEADSPRRAAEELRQALRGAWAATE